MKYYLGLMYKGKEIQSPSYKRVELPDNFFTYDSNNKWYISLMNVEFPIAEEPWGFVDGTILINENDIIINESYLHDYREIEKCTKIVFLETALTFKLHNNNEQIKKWVENTYKKNSKSEKSLAAYEVSQILGMYLGKLN